MPREIMINQALLDDPDFDMMSDRAQLAWFRLRLDHRLGISGLGRISYSHLQRSMGRRPDVEVMAELSRKWWRYDRDIGLLWITGSFRREPANPRVFSAVRVQELERLPRCRLIVEWCERYAPRWCELVDRATTANAKELAKRELNSFTEFLQIYGIDTLSIPSRDPVPVPVPVPVPNRREELQQHDRGSVAVGPPALPAAALPRPIVEPPEQEENPEGRDEDLDHSPEAVESGLRWLRQYVQGIAEDLSPMVAAYLPQVRVVGLYRDSGWPLLEVDSQQARQIIKLGLKTALGAESGRRFVIRIAPPRRRGPHISGAIA